MYIDFSPLHPTDWELNLSFGEGGKQQRRTKKPRTARGQAFLQEIEQGSQEFIRSLNAPTNTLPYPNHSTNQLHGLDEDEQRFEDGHDGSHDREPKQIDHRVQQLQDYLQSQDYIHRKILEEQQWDEVYDQMFSHFYECASKTASWGNPDNWDHNWKPQCQCTHPRSRPVVFVDLLIRKQEKVGFCDCYPDQVRLIQMGYMGGSPRFPRTAFSIRRLLRFHHILWKRSVVAMSPFSKAINEFLDAYNPLILVKNNTEDSNSACSVC
ncbi:hypothetical protein PGTUg99_011509 [Puccinia graminis f. sp. tritici]|uniref:CxC1-like cysteine cluster associated with KDZ transposases domain-containing protein n=1 Tax=Puccinia graminis f. sp. tritici TaxID=56615 RepID=A0A5B0M9G3_PUCGR|nr:hypothetical protein PGTUg99_011509 [Puccinia graminis f. sp. tritici]